MGQRDAVESLSVSEICDELGVGRNVVFAAINAGELPAIRAARQGQPWVVKRSALEKWLRDQKVATQQAVADDDRWTADAMWDHETGGSHR